MLFYKNRYISHAILYKPAYDCRRKKYISKKISLCSSYLCQELNHDLSSNTSTHNLLDYGDFKP